MQEYHKESIKNREIKTCHKFLVLYKSDRKNWILTISCNQTKALHYQCLLTLNSAREFVFDIFIHFEYLSKNFRHFTVIPQIPIEN